MSDFGIDPNTVTPPAVGDTTAPASPVATPQVTPVAATPATPAAAPTAAPEDRSNWVPPHRLRETREAAVREAQRTFAEQQAQASAHVQQLERQLQALVGVTPKQQTEADGIRNQFGQIFPGLAALEQRAQDLMQLVERAGEFDSQNTHYWDSHGRQTMNRLYSVASESMGVQLTDDAKRNLHASFVGYVQSSPEAYERYLNDPGLVEDFWKAFTSSFIDPVRRTATATVAGRAPVALPRDLPGGVPSPAPAPKPANMDERVSQMWSGYNAIKKF